MSISISFHFIMFDIRLNAVIEVARKALFCMIVNFIVRMLGKKLLISTKPNKILFRRLNKLRNTSSTSNLELSKTSQSRFQVKAMPQLVTPRSQSLLLLNKNQQRSQQRRNIIRKEGLNQTVQSCICGECNCGRHLCKLNVVKAELTNNRHTSYGRQFTRKEPAKSLILITKEIPIAKSASLISKSRYGQEFKESLQVTKNQPIIYKDNLKQDGPMQNITTYSQQFRPHKGCNQYVKPTNRCVIPSFPVKHKTTYSKEFVPKSFKRTKQCKFNDELAIGNKLWMGQSIYNLKFKNPNPQDYPKINPLMSKSQRILKNPDYLSRFTTNYRQQFGKKESSLCPISNKLSEKLSCSPLKNLLYEREYQSKESLNLRGIASTKYIYG